ncbi:hypothetical protein BT69DRAFT_1219761 [Atractiella rhizophila]|nr:hypothetical protein BT69DRAFT_1219761 [Atractiella rhizophila]
MELVLKERGLWPEKGLKGRCKQATDHQADHTCCAERLLASQPDFRTQKGAVVEAIEAAGHYALMLPKFHCQLNFIEFFWGRMKYYLRENCRYTFEGLKENMHAALKSVQLSTIRKFERRTHRWIQAYAEGKDVVQAGFQVRKYSSHRRVPEVAAARGEQEVQA